MNIRLESRYIPDEKKMNDMIGELNQKNMGKFSLTVQFILELYENNNHGVVNQLHMEKVTFESRQAQEGYTGTKL